MPGIRLVCKLSAQIIDKGQTELNPSNWYPVVGTYNRTRINRDGEKIIEDLFMLLDEESNRLYNIYPSKLKIKRDVKI